jgi:DNA mismatch repair ATPase MutS
MQNLFIVTAPKNQKHFRKIQELNSVESIITKVERRFEEFRSVRGTYNSRNDILSAIERISLDVISYEDWIEHFDQFKEIQQLLLAFYQNTLKYNLKLSKYE